jgi:hypothetical protein
MKGRDERKSYRCAVADPCHPCELKSQTDLLSAWLLDQSAGGFAVLVERLAGVEVEQIAHLHTDAGWFIVRVVHIAEVNPPEDDEMPADREAPWFRLGLLRMGEVAATAEPTTSLWADTLRCNFSQWCPGSGTLVILGVLLAIIVAALPVGFIAGYFRAGQPAAHDWITGSPASQSNRDKPSPNLAPPRDDASPFSSDTSDSSGGNSSSDSRSTFSSDRGQVRESSPSASLGRKWYETVHRLSGASPFAVPEVVQELQLTANQQKQIRQVIEAASQAIRGLDQQPGGQQRQEISQQRAKLFDQARGEALNILTAEQRAQWEKLTAGQ